MQRVWRYGRWILVSVAALIVVSLLTTWPADLLADPLVRQDHLVPADVIIVLGAGTNRGTDPLPAQAKSRVDRGLVLLEAGLAPRMIVAGGTSRVTGLNESALMAPYAVSHGARPDQVVREARSKNTYQNAVYSLAIMRERGWTTALVVTSPYHTWRACRIFEKQRATIRCVAAPPRGEELTSPLERLRRLRGVVREYGAIVLSYIRAAI